MAAFGKTSFLQYHQFQNFQFPENAEVKLSWFRGHHADGVVWAFQPRVFQYVNYLLFPAMLAGLIAAEVKALLCTNSSWVCSVRVAKI